MYVAKVKLENVRGFHGTRRVDLDLARLAGDSFAGWTVLVGPNGSGRSTLLRAIALALAGPQQAAALAGDAAGWLPAGQQRGGVELDLADGTYLGLELTADGLKAERNAPLPAGGVLAGYGPFRRFSGGIPMPKSRWATLFREDVSLSDGVAWLRGSREAQAIVADGLLPEPPDDWRALGDGARSLLALVADLLKQFHAAYGTIDATALAGQAVVLIDEVEAHLHPQWQQSIGFWLKEHFPGTQFIVTTNSPYIAQAADPRGLVHLPAHGSPYVLDDDAYRRVVFGSGEDAVLSELFGLDNPYSERARRLRRELVELELKVLDGQAGEIQLARYRDLQELLVSSPAARSLEIEARLAREKARRGTR